MHWYYNKKQINTCNLFTKLKKKIWENPEVLQPHIPNPWPKYSKTNHRQNISSQISALDKIYKLNISNAIKKLCHILFRSLVPLASSAGENCIEINLATFSMLHVIYTAGTWWKIGHFFVWRAVESFFFDKAHPALEEERGLAINSIFLFSFFF